VFKGLFGSDKRGKILLYLFTHGEAYPTEIAKAFQWYLNAVQNQLLNLERDGMVYSRLRGKVRLFGLNPRNPFSKEITAVFEKMLDFISEEDKEKFYRPRRRPRRSGKPL